MRSTTSLALLLVLLCGERPARACGVWQLEDKDLKRWVTFHVSSTVISRGPKNQGPRRLIQRLEARDPTKMYSLLGRHKDLYFEGDTLMRRGKPVAVLAGDHLKFKHLKFTVLVRPRKEATNRARWRVVILLGNKLMAQGDAMSICSEPAPEEEGDPKVLHREQQEIRQRVALYMAWRRIYRR